MNSVFTTHEVLNQSPPFENVNLFISDRALVEAVGREGGGAAVERLTSFGEACGSADAFERGRHANENPPRLKTFDSKGRRLDIVEFHPAYHECMAMSVAEGLHCSPWEHAVSPGGKPVAGANVARNDEEAFAASNGEGDLLNSCRVGFALEQKATIRSETERRFDEPEILLVASGYPDGVAELQIPTSTVGLLEGLYCTVGTCMKREEILPE